MSKSVGFLDLSIFPFVFSAFRFRFRRLTVTSASVRGLLGRGADRRKRKNAALGDFF